MVAAPALLAAVQAAGGELPECSCVDNCAVGAINADCAVCAVNMSECQGKAPEPAPVVEPEPDPEPEQPKATGSGGMLLLALAVFGITYRNEIWAVLTQQDARDAFIAFVHDSGFLGLLAFLGLQVLQVVAAVLPGESVELMAGLLYGTWGGLAL